MSFTVEEVAACAKQKQRGCRRVRVRVRKTVFESSLVQFVRGNTVRCLAGKQQLRG